MTPIESFTSEEGLWINKPAHVTQTEEQLLMRTGANTDFWVKTWYALNATPAMPLVLCWRGSLPSK